MSKSKNYAAELKKYAESTNTTLEYEDVCADGHAHIKRFVKRAVLNGQGFPIAAGNSEKEAKQNAAKSALRSLNEKENQRPEAENAAKNPARPMHETLSVAKINRASKQLIRAVQSMKLEPNNAAPCCSSVVGDDEFPAAAGKAKEEEAQLVHDEISGSASAQSPSWSDVCDDGAQSNLCTPPAALESCDAESKSVHTTTSDSVVFTKSMDQEQNPVVTPKQLTRDVQDASQSSNDDVMIPEKVKTGDSPSEKMSTQSETFRNKSEFDCMGHLGKGGFGRVFTAKEKLTGQCFAIKIVPCKENRKYLREVKALLDLHHYNIVRYFSCWLADTTHQCDSASDSSSSSQSSIDDSSMKYLYIQMELCDTKTLREWIDEKNVKKSLRDSKRRGESLTIAKQIISGVEYIHFKMFIHRDLKPANIMFGKDGEAKIGDFGLVTDDNNDDAENLMERTVNKGTPSYMAPEQKSQRTYDRKVDIFAVGLIYFELLWNISTVHERHALWNDVRQQKFPQGFSGNFGQEYMMIRPMLCVRPEDRPEARALTANMEEVSRRLNTEELVRRGSRTV